MKRSITLAQRGTNKNPVLKSGVLAGKKEYEVQETNVNELDLSQLIDELENEKSKEQEEDEEEESKDHTERKLTQFDDLMK